jgi:RNA polymerase sigma-70 factor (ECF subfamily)
MRGALEAEGSESQLGMDDDARLAWVAIHDREAFVTLYDRYCGPVERYVAARTGSEQVEDLVSITFTRALSRIHTFRPGRGTFAAWLFTIARHAVADHYRERARLAPSDGIAAVPASTPDPETVALAGEDRARIRAGFSKLTDGQRDALALRYAADLPFAAVARAMGKSEPAAKMLVQRGLQALRCHYQKDANDD